MVEVSDCVFFQTRKAAETPLQEGVRASVGFRKRVTHSETLATLDRND